MAARGSEAERISEGNACPGMGTTSKLEALVPGKSRQRMGSRLNVKERGLRIWQCVRNKEVEGSEPHPMASSVKRSSFKVVAEGTVQIQWRANNIIALYSASYSQFEPFAMGQVSAA